MSFLEYIENNSYDKQYIGCEKCDLCSQVQCTPKSIREEICFWAVGAIQHIRAVLESNGTDGLTITSDTLRELHNISNEFEDICKELECDPCGKYRGESPCCDKGPKCLNPEKYENGLYDYEDKICINYEKLYYILECFLCINSKLIVVLNRIMFEGFGGQAVLFEKLNHFMIEQIYVSRIFQRIMKSPSFQDERNVWGPDFYNAFGIGCDNYECAYIQMYFWNNISAQHVSLLLNVTPEFEEELPKETAERFKCFREGFNQANIDLGEYYSNKDRDSRWCKKLSCIAENIYELNQSFIEFLCSLSIMSQGKLLPCNTPCEFFSTREHVLNEQYYYGTILKRIVIVLKQ